MDHDEAVRQKMTEKYLLDELDHTARDEFEEHFFDCSFCALDVRAGAMFVEQCKIVFAEKPAETPLPARAVGKGRFAWLRPAFAAPALALLLAVIAYQNLVTYSQMRRAMNQPQVLPWASVNLGTWGSGGPVIATSPGKGFLLFVRIPPGGGYSRYTVDLYDPSKKLMWSLTIPADSAQDQWPIQVPGTDRDAGTYTVAVRGTSANGENKEVGRASFELQIQK
jgi:hypothetical protein